MRAFCVKPRAKKNPRFWRGFLRDSIFYKSRHEGDRLFAVLTDCLYGTSFHGLFTKTFLLGRFGLFEHVGVSPVVIALEVSWSGFAAKIAVNALVIDIECALNVLCVAV